MDQLKKSVDNQQIPTSVMHVFFVIMVWYEIFIIVYN